jgi:hypothetical protein
MYVSRHDLLHHCCVSTGAATVTVTMRSVLRSVAGALLASSVQVLISLYLHRPVFAGVVRATAMRKSELRSGGGVPLMRSFLGRHLCQQRLQRMGWTAAATAAAAAGTKTGTRRRSGTGGYIM